MVTGMLTRRSLFRADLAPADSAVSRQQRDPVIVAAEQIEQDQTASPGSLVAPALVFALAACGGDGSTSPTTPPPPAPLAVKKAANDAEAVRFLTQASLGAQPADIATLKADGYIKWMDAEIAKPLGETASEAYNSLGGGDPANGDFFSSTFHTEVMWRQFFKAGDPFRKRAAFALSQFFVVGIDGVTLTWFGASVTDYWGMLVRNAFGNFRTLLEDVTLHPAMGDYLSLRGSQRENSSGRRPDENYAREVMQLFTIGLVQLELDGSIKKDAAGNAIPTYTNDDVTGIASALSGWDLQGERSETFNTTPNISVNVVRRPMTSDMAKMLYVNNAAATSRHSALEQKFLGATIPANTSAPDAMKVVLDTLFNHANTGPFFAKQMIQRLVTSNPSPAYVRRVAEVFNNNGSGVRGDLASVFKAILIDDEARGAAGLSSQTFGKVREPFLRLIQWAHTFKLKEPASGSYALGQTSQQSTALGQMVMRSPSVFNFFRPGFTPAGTAIASNNLVAPEFQIVNEVSTIGYINYITNVVANRQSTNLIADYVDELAIANDSTALVNRLDLMLTANQLTQATKDKIKQAVDSIVLPATADETARLNRVTAAITLVMASPQYLIQK
jgi:uncharacterized protein (DUF1800 family)